MNRKNMAEHVAKNFYPENYKMDLSETMKKTLLSGSGIGGSSGLSNSSIQQNEKTGGPSGSNSSSSSMNSVGHQQQSAGVGYVTEKLYMLLQLYLQNKGWNPSVELLQCFSDLKDSAMLPSAAYLQVLANRLTLDSQGRLVLRENGKIVLPFEHFANAIMLKHMSGPHGLHLSVDATVRAVVESYTIGRENFGMEKDFIIEVVQSCPSPACRYYKNHIGIPPLSLFEQYPGVTPDFLQHLPPPPQTVAANSVHEIDLSKNHGTGSQSQKIVPSMASHLAPPPSPKPSSVAVQQQLQQAAAAQQHQITQAILQQQQQQQQSQRAALEKQRALEKKHYTEVQNAVAAVAAAANSVIQVQDYSRLGLMQSVNNNKSININNSINSNSSHQSSPSPLLQPPLPPQTPTPTMVHIDNNPKITASDLLKSNLETLESNKDLLALHNGAWGGDYNRDGLIIGQDKIVRAFSELMRNMARMKTFIRPSMCKPYGKQSESLQKTLMDTIQLVQTLRSCLPAPHIQVSSWKSENRTDTPDSINRIEN